MEAIEPEAAGVAALCFDSPLPVANGTTVTPGSCGG